MSKYVIKTIQGYDFFEVSSALQKSIRRGLEDDALYWAIELYDSGYHRYAWKRMVVMVSEDVGLVDHDAMVRIMALKQAFDFLYDEKDRKGQAKLPYVQAVIYLVNCHKSRYIDWRLNVAWQEHYAQEFRKEIPDYALDIHTRRGKAMGRTIKDFFTTGSKLQNHVPLKGEKEAMDTCYKRWTLPDEEKLRRFPRKPESKGDEEEKPNQMEMF